LFQQQLAALHQAQARGELAVVYADECRFSPQAPVPYAGQVRGQAPVGLPAERGGGASVLGRWHALGAGQPLRSYAVSGAWTADLFAATVEAYCQTLSQPTVLVLDKASILTPASTARPVGRNASAAGRLGAYTCGCCPPTAPNATKSNCAGTASGTTGSPRPITTASKPWPRPWREACLLLEKPIRLLLSDYLFRRAGGARSQPPSAPLGRVRAKPLAEALGLQYPPGGPKLVRPLPLAV
jgi:hypothetical protein